jgi:hypothetical protein
MDSELVIVVLTLLFGMIDVVKGCILIFGTTIYAAGDEVLIPFLPEL